MRKIVLLFGGIMAFAFVSAQTPQISVEPEGLSFEVVSGETGTKKIAIHNTGGRDLEWEAGAYWDKVFFEKKDSVDWTLSQNQDPITENVILTRGNSRGLFNITVEDGFDQNLWDSPKNTLWADDMTKYSDLADYRNWGDAIGWNPPDYVGYTISMYSIEDEMFWDITMESWTEGAGGGQHQGGGFAYTRVTPVTWIDFEDNSGIVAPINLDSLIVYADADGLAEGTYEGQFVLESNDPDMPALVVPVTMTVVGSAEIELDDSDIDFDTISVGNTATYMLEIMNPGSSVLELTLSTSTSEFSTSADLLIDPFDMSYLPIMFGPGTIDLFEDTLLITSLEPDTTIKLALFGEGVAAPVMEVSPLSFELDTVPGYVLIDTFKIKNTGPNTLIFSVKEAPVSFTKLDYADWTLPENQDRISDDVWISRADQQGLFNVAAEISASDDSPLGTEWAAGSVPNHLFGEFESFRDATDACPPCMVGEEMTLYLTEEDEYHYLMLDDWSSGGSGGGFSYTRTQIPPWFVVSNLGESLAPGDSTYIIWEVDGTDATAGSWPFTITLMTNDPENTEVELEVLIHITGQPEIDAPIDIVFDDTFIGNTETLSFPIFNEGSDTLHITSMSFDSTVFAVDPQMAVIDFFEGVLEVEVMYTPVGAYETVDTLRIFSDDPNMPEFKIEVSGTGLLPPDISVMPLSFDEIFNAGSMDTVKVYMENTGDADLEWEIMGWRDMVEFEKEDGADWTLSENQDRITDDVWITRGENDIIFNIAKESSASRNSSPKGTLWSDMPTYQSSLGDYTTYWNAIGGGCASCVEGETLSLNIEDTEMYYDILFRSWSEGGGGDGLVAGGIAYTRFEAYQWIVPIDESGTIAPGEKDSALVILDASMLAKGEYDGNIKVLSNVPTKMAVDVPVSITLEGAPKIGFDADSVDFDTTFIGGSDVVMLEISNDSTETLMVSLSNALDVFSTEEANFMVEPGETYPLYVEFMPTVSMTYMDTLVISSNDAMNPMIKIPMDGTGKASPVILIDPMYTMDTLFFDSTTVQSVTFTNTGDGELMFMLVDGPSWVDEPAVLGDTLAKDESVTIDATLDASGLAGGSYMGYLIVESNDPLSPVDSVVMSLYVNGMFVNMPIDDMLKQVGFGIEEIDVSMVFVNAQEDSIGITPISSDTEVATVSYMDDTLTVTETGTGTTIITLMGTDAHGSREFFDFNFRVNTPPMVANPLADATMNEGFSSGNIDLADVFSDADDDALTMTATSRTATVVTVAVVGNTLTLSEVGIGNSEIVVTADDGAGAMETDTFMFTVNAVPVEATPITDMTLTVGFGTENVDIGGVFTDADGDALSYTASSSSTAVVTVSVSGSSLSITEAGVGDSDITITASDGMGGEGMSSFKVSVEAAIDAIDDVNLTHGINLYPNPSTGLVYLNFDKPVSEQLIVRVFDITGKEVFAETFESIETKAELDLSELHDGLYHIRVYNRTEIIFVHEIIIQ